MNQTGGKIEIIQNAILDFSNTCRLYEKDSIFSVSYEDSVYRMVLDKLNNRNYKWIRGEILEGLVAVSIVADYNSFLLTKEIKVGSKGKLPSRYIEKNGKLFYWWDNDYPLTKEALNVYHKYNLLQDDKGGEIKFPNFTIDDNQKAAHYYFCKENLIKYKKIITNEGIGYYNIPKLNCE